MRNNEKPVEYKLITSIWVLSCNDKLPQMTYRSIFERIESIDINKARELVSKFPELFQTTIPLKHFESWKEEMLQNKSRPKWIALAPNQKEIIENLTLNDIFRNRFRNSIDAMTVDAEILKWGLDYLKEIYEAKEKQSERIWQRLSYFVLPLFSIIVAGLSIWSSNNSINNKLVFEKTKFEKELILPNYNEFLTTLSNSLHSGTYRDDKTYLIDEISKARSTLFKLAPYMDRTDFDSLKKELHEYQIILLKANFSDSITYSLNEELSLKYSKIQIHFMESIAVKLKFN